MSDDDKLKFVWWKLLLMALIPLALIMGAFIFGVRQVGADGYHRLVSFISENYFGLGSVFLFVYLVDTFIVPLTGDLIFPLVVGMKWYIVVPLIGFASFLGGVSGYLLGNLCSKIPVVNRLTDKIIAKWGAYLDKYGIVVIILSTLTPIPFSTVAWASGIFKYSKRKAFPAFLLRFVRMGLYFVLFRAGLSTALL